MVTFNVSGQLFTLAETDILKYPYSKLADVSSFTLADDIASLDVPADVCSTHQFSPWVMAAPPIYLTDNVLNQSFAILAHYLSTHSFPPDPLPPTLESTFRTLGIPYPFSPSINQYTASIGASGTLREWEARLPTSSDATSSSEQYEALRAIQAGLLTGRTRAPLPPPNKAETSDELPAYSDISGTVASEHDLIPAIVQNLDPNGVGYVVLIPSDERSLVAIERPSWDVGTGAANDEEVLSFSTTPREQKKVLRLSAGGGYTWDRISQPEFQSGVRRDLQQALYHSKFPPPHYFRSELTSIVTQNMR